MFVYVLVKVEEDRTSPLIFVALLNLYNALRSFALSFCSKISLDGDSYEIFQTLTLGLRKP